MITLALGASRLTPGRRTKISNTPDSAATGGGSADVVNTEGDSSASGELKIPEPTILAEMADDAVVLFGEIPEGVELPNLGLTPGYDQVQFSRIFGSIGNVGMITDNIAETATSARGLSRLNEVALLLLRSGSEFVVRGGAKLGAISENGKVIAQACFISVSVTVAAALAAIGPVVVMIVLQVQLDEISSLVQINIALTIQALKAIRNEQWSELEDLVDSIDGAS